MKKTIIIFKITSYLLIIVDLILLILGIISEILFGKIISFNKPGQVNTSIGKWFVFFDSVHTSLLVIIFLWVILFLLIILFKKFSLKKAYSKIGLLGFCVAVFYLVCDPFGLTVYLID